MDIYYLGHSAFRLKGKKVTVVTDPFDPKMVGLAFPKVDADVVTISHAHADHNYLEAVKNYKKVLQGPGEYEIAGVSFFGIPTYHDSENGKHRGNNTIFVIEMDGVRIAHLGDLGHKLSEKVSEEMGEIDVLLVPVGGTYTLDAKTAAEVTTMLEPKVVIPMHFKAPNMPEETFGNLETVDAFVSHMGSSPKTLPKLSVTAGSLSSEEIQVVILETK